VRGGVRGRPHIQRVPRRSPWSRPFFPSSWFWQRRYDAHTSAFVFFVLASRIWLWRLKDDRGRSVEGWATTVTEARCEATKLYTAWKRAELYYGP
jgi:hypothetical protein